MDELGVQSEREIGRISRPEIRDRRPARRAPLAWLPPARVLGTEAQTSRQAGAQGAVKELPFTGIAAIPIILVGLALLMAGVLLRRARLRAES